jgi:hypothetical protein
MMSLPPPVITTVLMSASADLAVSYWLGIASLSRRVPPRPYVR